jgi:hypothetical protein
MTSYLLFDLALTAAASVSLVGILALAAVILPWRDEELKAAEEILAGAIASGRAAARTAVRAPARAASRPPRLVSVERARRAA